MAPEPPSLRNMPNCAAVAETEHEAVLPCVISSDRPPMATVPTRDMPVALAAIFSDTVPEPRVAVRPLTVIQLEKDDAVHGHCACAVRPTVRLVAVAPTLALVELNPKSHVE